jgi:hypothetical protein
MAQRGGPDATGLLRKGFPGALLLVLPLVLIVPLLVLMGRVAGPQAGSGGGGPAGPLVEGSAGGAAGGVDAGFARPDSIRGIYLNAWAAGSERRVGELLDYAARNRINTFVVDLKDASGFVSHPTSVPEARRIGADRELRIRDPGGLLARFRGAGIYPIARIVVFQDPVLARGRPEWTVLGPDGTPWVDGRGDRWVNPWSRPVWDYNVALAREAAALGFPEVQWDYVRFPDRPASELASARFPGADGRPRTEAVRGFLVYARGALADLPIRVTADVFGVSATARHDVGVGQVWESFIDVVDAALPMIYPSHWARGTFGFENPNAHPYAVVERSLSAAIERSRAVEGAGEIVPWLQAFTLGSPPYGAHEIREQIRGVHAVGLADWILWNPGSRYPELR